MSLTRLKRLTVACVLGATAGLSAGCEVSIAGLTGHATETVTRSYPLKPGGLIRIANVNGRIDFEAADSDTVEVATERIARAATDHAAKDILGRVNIREDVTADRVSLETGSMGMMVAASLEIRYRVRAPRAAAVNLKTVNGRIAVDGGAGTMELKSTNGAIEIRGTTGAVTAGTTNGPISASFSTVDATPIALETTNGRVELVLPRDARANLDASCTNGRIDVSGLTLESSEQSRRHVIGRLNGGGAAVSVRTTNGGIRVRAAS